LTSGDRSQSVVVVVDDRAEVPGGILDLAAKEAARIYRHADVKLEWRAMSDPRSAALSNGLVTSPGDFTVRVIVQPGLPATVGAPSPSVLGAAPPLSLECVGVVYLYFDRVIETARAQRVTPSLVLGAAVAHEIGHLLLRRGGHSAEGLMRASWKTADWQRAALGLLLFSPHEGKTIRSALSACR
jgi:hypothetical protein